MTETDSRDPRNAPRRGSTQRARREFSNADQGEGSVRGHVTQRTLVPPPRGSACPRASPRIAPSPPRAPVCAPGTLASGSSSGRRRSSTSRASLRTAARRRGAKRCATLRDSRIPARPRRAWTRPRRAIPRASAGRPTPLPIVRHGPIPERPPRLVLDELRGDLGPQHLDLLPREPQVLDERPPHGVRDHELRARRHRDRAPPAAARPRAGSVKVAKPDGGRNALFHLRQQS